ncbi:MAG TPA: ATP-binding protein [Candidatus Limnocylindrales bacterium]|nr:ATP-binding protein [Candidatus Limnocylindrales bacterium]
MGTKHKAKDSLGIKRSKDQHKMPHASVKEAVQKRITPKDHSSIIPGLDMNEIMHSLDLLRYALDYSEAIVDTVRLPLVVLNKKLEVLTANRSFYETFKLSPKETENKLIYNLNNNAWDIPKLKILLEKILPKNTNFENYEVEIDFPLIGRKVILLNARKTYRQVNQTEAILLACEDITNRKQLDNQKDDFIAIVSHELRTPLTSIKLFSQLLEKHHAQNEDKKGIYLLSKMTNQMERLTQLMASFVNVYQIQNGKLMLKKNSFDLEDLISSIVLDFQFTTKSHTVVNKSGLSKISIFADKERISQVMINLLSNAIKYSPKADKIIISTTEDSKNVTVSIQDFGMGVPKSEEDKIFERFFRVKGKKENSISGLGLGLFISHEIIDQHKGKLWVESIEGKGSKFSFSLPIKKRID